MKMMTVKYLRYLYRSSPFSAIFPVAYLNIYVFVRSKKVGMYDLFLYMQEKRRDCPAGLYCRPSSFIHGPPPFLFADIMYIPLRMIPVVSE